MKRHNNISDEQLAAYLDHMVAEERTDACCKVNCSFMPDMCVTDNCQTDADEPVAEESLADVETLEIINVSREALDYFKDSGKSHNAGLTHRKGSRASSAHISLQKSSPSHPIRFYASLASEDDTDDDK